MNDPIKHINKKKKKKKKVLYINLHKPFKRSTEFIVMIVECESPF